MNGLLFPGQGSQAVGMGMSLCNCYPNAAELLMKANDILGYDLKELMMNGPADTLTDTVFAQPAIFTCSAMYMEKLRDLEIDFEYVAGHSLGEYSALYAAGVFSFEQGLRLVAERGKAMGRMNGRGTMAAILGMTEDELGSYVNRIESIVMANLNTKTQIVVSGDIKGIIELERLLDNREDVKIVHLSVSAAFHSPHMDEAKEHMKKMINNASFHAPICYVVSNVSGKPTKDIGEIKKNLIDQITGQVRWYDSIMSIKAAGVTCLYEVGYGDVLKKMNKAITLKPKCISI